MMHFAITTPNFGPYSDVRLLADLAYEAEVAGDLEDPTSKSHEHPPSQLFCGYYFTGRSSTTPSWLTTGPTVSSRKFSAGW
jgi:hypothetical protein